MAKFGESPLAFASILKFPAALPESAQREALARIGGAGRPAIVMVAHGWGGGVRRHVDDLAALIADRCEVFHLLPAGGGQVALHRHGGALALYFTLPADGAALAALLRSLSVVRFHFHHVHGLPQSVFELPRSTGVPYDCTLHDYFAFCPQHQLVDVAGRYCGEPDEAGCRDCLAQRAPQWPLDIVEWRELFGGFLAGAERVIAPVEDDPGAAWTIRRANLLVSGVANPRAAGGLLKVGPVLLKITGETQPCVRMDEQLPGLWKALEPDWLGGLTAMVREGGEIAVGHEVAWVA